MKTQVNKLDFKKNDLVELNDAQLEGVNGGTFTIPIGPILPIITILFR